MNGELDNWPGSVMDICALAREVGRFLRTHRVGEQLLYEWLSSLPPDRSEEEYERECQEECERHEASICAFLQHTNTRRRAAGLGEFDRDFNLISGPGAPRNKKQSARPRAERAEVARLLRDHPHLKPKDILRVLNWPCSKLRTVQNHVRSVR